MLGFVLPYIKLSRDYNLEYRSLEYAQILIIWDRNVINDVVEMRSKRSGNTDRNTQQQCAILVGKKDTSSLAPPTLIFN